MEKTKGMNGRPDEMRFGVICTNFTG